MQFKAPTCRINGITVRYQYFTARLAQRGWRFCVCTPNGNLWFNTLELRNFFAPGEQIRHSVAKRWADFLIRCRVAEQQQLAGVIAKGGSDV